LVSEFAPEDRDHYENLVLALWALPHREEKYLARGLAVSHKQYMVPESLPLFRRMITEGAWWALREYTKTDADLVAGFVNDHREELSGLSFREATKHIGHLVDR
ncbi:MAG: DNA alkylation repair protein, partial [Actinobacteria bacterium]|nr:DNA alkylation repair protein [Actinomycetota bacterium]